VAGAGGPRRSRRRSRHLPAGETSAGGHAGRGRGSSGWAGPVRHRGIIDHRPVGPRSPAFGLRRHPPPLPAGGQRPAPSRLRFVERRGGVAGDFGVERVRRCQGCSQMRAGRVNLRLSGSAAARGRFGCSSVSPIAGRDPGRARADASAMLDGRLRGRGGVLPTARSVPATARRTRDGGAVRRRARASGGLSDPRVSRHVTAPRPPSPVAPGLRVRAALRRFLQPDRRETRVVSRLWTFRFNVGR
jgi:hypothetical protein